MDVFSLNHREDTISNNGCILSFLFFFFLLSV